MKEHFSTLFGILSLLLCLKQKVFSVVVMLEIKGKSLGCFLNSPKLQLFDLTVHSTDVSYLTVHRCILLDCAQMYLT